MRQVFHDTAAPPSNPMGICVDSKRRKNLMQKRVAMDISRMPMAVAEQFWVICRTNCTFNRKEREVNRVFFCMYPKMLLKHLFVLTVTKNV